MAHDSRREGLGTTGLTVAGVAAALAVTVAHPMPALAEEGQQVPSGDTPPNVTVQEQESISARVATDKTIGQAEETYDAAKEAADKADAAAADAKAAKDAADQAAS